MQQSKFWISLALTLAVSVAAFASEVGSDASTESQSEQVPEASPGLEIIGLDEGEKLFFQDGRYALLKVTPEATGSQDLLLGSESLPAGTAIPVHSHDAYGEILLVHDGQADLTLGDRTERAAPGAVMYVPPGTWHGVANPEGGEATIFFVFPNPDMVDFFRSVGFSEGETPPRLTGEDWGKILQKHRMRSRPPAK